MKNYYQLTQRERELAFIQACKKGLLEDVKYLLTSPELKNMVVDISCPNEFGVKEDGFRAACYGGKLEVIKYLLTSSDLTVHSDILTENGSCLYFASVTAHFDVVEYLLTHPKLNQFHDLTNRLNEVLKSACFFGHIPTIDLVLYGSHLCDHANLHHNDGEAIIEACKRLTHDNPDTLHYLSTLDKFFTQQPKYYPDLYCNLIVNSMEYGHFNIAKYVFNLAQRTYPLNIHYKKDKLFRFACEHQCLDIVHYLIFEREIKQTAAITEYLESSENVSFKDSIQKLFWRRELNKTLVGSLNTKVVKTHRAKV